MTTSGITAWSMTATDLITEALVENAIISPGKIPRANELSVCMVRLNGLLKSLSGLWLEDDTTATVLANNASVVLDDGIADVVGARVVVSATNEQPLALWERDDYFGLPNKASTSTGGPTACYPAKQRDAITLYVWPIPTANTTLSLDVMRTPETVTAGDQTLDLPQEYQQQIYTILARRCARLFGISPTPDLIADADRFERELIDAERPNSYFMGPAHYPAYYE